MSTGARPSVEYCCKLLVSHGISHLTAELLRKAKFGHPEAEAPLLAAIHDLVLLHAAGWPQHHALRLQQLKEQVAAERLSSDLPLEGLLVVASCLLEWGCPPALLLQLLEGTQLPQQLAGGLQAVPSHHNISGLGTSLPPSQSSSGSSAVHTTQAAPGAKTGNNADSSNRSGSRAALLVLVWLVAHCGLFQRHLQQLQAALDRLPWLPPWPQDTRNLPATSAARAAAQHSSQQQAAAEQALWQAAEPHTGQPRLPPGSGSSSGRGNVQRNTATSSSSSSSSFWVDVEAAAHTALRSTTAVQSRLRLLTGQLLARDKLLWRVQSLQQQHPQHQFTAQGLSASEPLTGYELHLLANRQLLQQHQQALDAAVLLLQQQVECIQHAQAFFGWAGSVLTEQQQQQQQQQQQVSLSDAHGSCRQALTGRGSALVAAAPSAAGRPSGGDCGTRVTPSDLLPLLQQLPSRSSPEGQHLLEQLLQQLQEEEEEHPASASSSTGGLEGCTKPDAALQQLSGLRLGHTAMPSSSREGQAQGLPQEPPSRQSASAAAGGGGAASSSRGGGLQPPLGLADYTAAAAHALLQAGCILCAPVALQPLPPDITSALQQQQQQQQQQHVGGSSHRQEREGAAAAAAAGEPVVATVDTVPHLVAEKFCASSLQTKCSPAGPPTAAAAAGAVHRAGPSSGSTGFQPPHHRQQQPQQQEGAGGAAGSGAREVQRVQQLAVAAARRLARVRAAHKQQLLAAAGQLQGP